MIFRGVRPCAPTQICRIHLGNWYHIHTGKQCFKCRICRRQVVQAPTNPPIAQSTREPLGQMSVAIAATGVSSMCSVLHRFLGGLHSGLTEPATSSCRQRQWQNESHRALQQHPAAMGWTTDTQNTFVFQEGCQPCRSNLELHPSLQCEFELLEHYCCIITATTNGKMASTTK